MNSVLRTSQINNINWHEAAHSALLSKSSCVFTELGRTIEDALFRRDLTNESRRALYFAGKEFSLASFDTDEGLAKQLKINKKSNLAKKLLLIRAYPDSRENVLITVLT